MTTILLIYAFSSVCIALSFFYGDTTLRGAAFIAFLLQAACLIFALNRSRKKFSGERQKLESHKREIEILEENFRRELDTDPLTSLYKRNYLLARGEEALEKKHPFTIFYIDLNKFKVINDIQGHNVGDVVLKTTGSRLRELNDESIFFARFGGDEFAALLYDTSPTRISEVSILISATIRQKILYNGFDFEVDASIGVARYPNDGTSMDQLVKLADIAMYHAKRNDLEHSYIISREFTETFRHRNLIETLLRKMNYETDLSLDFQPQFNIMTRELIGMEALVRWPASTAGEVPPAEFIPIAEEIGVIKDITRWVFIHGIKQIKKWNDKYGNDLVMHLNVSQNCIHHKIFFGNLTWMIEAFGIKPSWLGIELTEYSAMHSPEYMNSLLHSISDLGVKITIDDFGTGNSSLTCIKRFGLDYIKIDKSLIDEIETDRNNFIIIKAIIQMAHCMSLKAVAEGVETRGQLNRLKQLGCDAVQGFIFGRPVNEKEFERLYFSDQKGRLASVTPPCRERSAR